MGLYANYPIALAPGMGLNAYFSFTVVQQMGVPWPIALGCVFISGVAFLLLTVRKVTREVPVSRTVSAAVGGGAKVAAAAAAGATAAKLTGGGEEPYGSGSLRLAAGAVVPSGYTIKGNEDSMLYHTTESPWYKQTIAEVWFNAESAAQRAGFTRWDAKDKGASGVAKLADVPAGPYGKGSAKAGAGGSAGQAVMRAASQAAVKACTSAGVAAAWAAGSTQGISSRMARRPVTRCSTVKARVRA